ncbi:transposase [Nonomuraea fastidiosa]|uniref:transposase n=1 Tax=Nonomuraea TaxID=83681 RepID=UPI00366D2966
MVDDLQALPARPGRLILAARNAKEDLLDLLSLARTHPDRHVIADRLFRFYDRCAASGLPELHRLATTIETWWPEILAFLRTAITNAGAEGTNRVIKPPPAMPTASATPETNGYAPMRAAPHRGQHRARSSVVARCTTGPSCAPFTCGDDPRDGHPAQAEQ